MSMNERMVWIEDDHFKGWHCSECSWAISAIRVDTTVAVLAFNRAPQEGFERHNCLSTPSTPKNQAHTAGTY